MLFNIKNLIINNYKMNSNNKTNYKEFKHKCVIEFINQAVNPDKKPMKVKDFCEISLIYGILMECDYEFFFNNLNLTFDKSLGIVYTEFSELINLMSTYVQKKNDDLNQNFKKLTDITISLLVSADENELEKFIDLILLVILNCLNKEYFIEKLLSMEENIQAEILNVIEQYSDLSDDENDDHNIRNSITKINNIKKSEEHNDTDSISILNHMSNINNDNIEKENTKLKLDIEDLKKAIKASENLNSELEQKILKLSIDLSNSKNEKEKLIQDLNNDFSNKTTSLNNKISDLDKQIKQKDESILNLKKDITNLNKNYSQEIEKSKDTIYSLNSKLIEYDNFKQKIEVMEKKLKENEYLQEKINFYEGLMNTKEFMSKNTNNNNSKEINNDSNKKIDLLEKSLKDKDESIDMQKRKIIKLEQDLNEINSNIAVNKISNNVQKTDDNKSVINNQNDLTKQISELKKKLIEKTEELENLKLENENLKESYESEQKLMSLSMYNIGVNFINHKLSQINCNNDNQPSWLTKERLKLYNGDL